MSDGPTCDLSKPWEEPAPKPNYPRGFECIKGRSVDGAMAYTGMTVGGRTAEGVEFILMAPTREDLEILWRRLVPEKRLGDPIYRAAVMPAKKFEGVGFDPNAEFNQPAQCRVPEGEK